MEADTKVLRKTQGFNVLVCVSLVCYVRATLQNSALYTTILENFRLKKTLENKSFSAIYGVTIKDPAASNGVSNLQRCRAAGYLTLAAVAKCLQAATWLVARGNKVTIYI